MQWAADATITGKLNGKWSTDGSLTFRAIGQVKLPPDLASKLPAEVQPLFENGSMSFGYQWKVDTHGSADARQWTLVSGQTGYLDAQSYSFTSPGQSVTGSRAWTLAALGNGIFDFFKGGKFGGHVAANVTVALSPKLRDQINSYMHSMFGTYSKQVNQDTKKLQDSNVQLQKDLKKGQGSQNQQDIKNLGNQIGAQSGQLQKDISQYQKGTAQGVYDILRGDGFHVSVVQNPTLTLEGDVTATRRILDVQDGPAILVGHSYGGAVISEAGNHEKVAGLVYVTAFALDKGESVNTMIADPPPGAPVPPILPPQDGFLFLDRDKFAESFAADLPAEQAAFMADSQVPWGVDALSGAVSQPAWRAKPSWYLIATDDRMIPPPAQRAMSERAGSVVVETSGSHSVYVSKPAEVAALVKQAAAAV